MRRTTVRFVTLVITVLVVLSPLGGLGLSSVAATDVSDTPDTTTGVSPAIEPAGSSIEEADQSRFSILPDSNEVAGTPAMRADAGTLDVGLELQQTATVTRGNDVTISTFVNNRDSQSVSGVDIRLVVDADNNGQFTASESVTTQTTTLAPSTVETVNLTYTNVSLAPGTYSYQSQAVRNGTVVQSFTNGTLTVTGDEQPTATLDVGLELQQTVTVTRGNDVTISTFANNRGSQSVSGVDIRLLVDADNDSQFTASESVTTQTTTLPAGEVETVNLTYTNVSLAPGTYSYQSRAVRNGTVVQSFTNGTLTVTDGPSTPRGRALQAAGVDDPANITQNDITIAITRRDRGQQANGIDVDQNDITTLITLRDRAA